MNTLTPQEVLQALIDGKNLEFKHSSFKKWTRLNLLDNPLSLESIFSGGVSFRLVQDTVTVGDISFPKPESEPLEFGTEYWRVEPSYMHYAMAGSLTWDDDSYDNMYLKRGLVHRSRENAIAHTEALIKLSGGSEK